MAEPRFTTSDKVIEDYPVLAELLLNGRDDKPLVKEISKAFTEITNLRREKMEKK